ncbi:3-phosphoshikimate 1-carboxyvinyltransferase [Halococcus qingdaonensis]|uniref:3-phosphoshikimate 1-carboxyvinyltransferase n=1 Tax=Halococcus qingdaonensis TaxID=224402 RepID=UPI002115F7DA|nr:3-phosphoshikimate 1-carboxyvinyltransferase [Halococcus qingdaonensis]
MNADIGSSRVSGTVRAPPSKSYTHRAILAAGYGDGTTRIERPLVSADTRATARAVEAFGGRVEGLADDSEHITVEGFGHPETPANVVDCANSGTTMRLVTATAALAEGLTVLTGDGSLRSRPHGPLLAAIEELGGRAESTRANGQAPLVVGGPMEGGRVSMPGDVSSQFVTALLMAGARSESGIEIDLETELKSSPYVEITRELLADFGVETENEGEGFAVAGGQAYDAGGEYRVPGDFSSISYLLAAGALAADDELTVEGARPSAQGDSAIVEILDRMGAEIAWERDAGTISIARSPLSGVEIDVGDTPDLLPTLAVLGAAADGETRLVNAEHVRYKETDRVSAMADELETMGATVTEREDSLTIHGDDSALQGARVDGRGDHRIVMALAIAGLVADGTTTVVGADHVDVSFPDFFAILSDAGADVTLN